MQIILQRTPYNEPFPCTPGTMSIDGEYFGETLERPWRENQNNISCIPPGEYPVTISMSNRFKKEMLEIQNVPGRSGIRIHCANFVEELRGCIAVASKRYNPAYISGCNAPKLFEAVQAALSRGEAVQILIRNPEVTQKETP